MQPSSRVRPPLRPPVEAVLELGEFDNHGTSRALFNGKSVEVEHGIPGETVDALVYGKRRRWAKIETVLTPAPDRVAAPCPHFHQGCGGCQWQMLAYQSQLQRKLDRARRAFDEHSVPWRLSTVHSPTDKWRYRATAGLSLGASAGFRRRGSQSIVAIHDCPISHPLVGRVADSLNQAIDAGSIPNYFGEVGVEVRVAGTAVDAPVHTCVVPSPGSRHASIDGVMDLAVHLAKLDGMVGVMYRHKQNPPEVLFGEPFAWVELDRNPFAMSAATFFQTNLELVPALMATVHTALPRIGQCRLVDIYGGVGLLGLSLSSHVAEVVEIEIDPVGIEAARLTAERQNLSNVVLLSGTAETHMAALERADIVVVDPPRSGLTPKVIEAINRLKPSHILYVSCLAVSMARDVAEFQQLGYQLGPVTAFDFYPQTYHLELFGRLDLVS